MSATSTATDAGSARRDFVVIDDRWPIIKTFADDEQSMDGQYADVAASPPSSPSAMTTFLLELPAQQYSDDDHNSAFASDCDSDNVNKQVVLLLFIK